MTRLLLLLVFLLSACDAPITLTPNDYAIADRDVCLFEVDPDPRQAEIDMLAEFTDDGIAITYWNEDHATHFRKELRLPRHHKTDKTLDRAARLVHERVHSCQWRLEPDFGPRYLDPWDPRFRILMETPADRQMIRGRVTWGEDTCNDLEAKIRSRVRSYRGFYRAEITNLDEVVVPILWQEIERKCGPAPAPEKRE